MNYQEIQRFSSLVWVWFAILPIAGGLWYATFQQLIVGQPVGIRPVPDALLLLFWLAFGIVMPLCFFWGGMRTEVRAEGLYLEGYPVPMCHKQFAYSEIETYEARRYHPLSEFGGWGIRWGLSSKAYTVRGNQGVQLVFKTGKRLLIGSQYPDQLVSAIARASAKENRT